MKSKRQALFLLVSVGLLVMGTGCANFGTIEVGPDRTDTERVEAGDVAAVDATVEMGVGELQIEQGGDSLLDATFNYNVDAWAPVVEYSTSGNQGQLVVRQPEANVDNIGIPDADIRYQWDLQFGDDVPLDLTINLGVGESDLQLSGLPLRNLDINTGVGQTNIDLSGDWQEDVDVRISGGVGETVLMLPRSTGVRLQSETALGNLTVNGLRRDGDVYTNDAFGASDVTMDIEIRGGVGSITIDVVE